MSSRGKFAEISTNFPLKKKGGMSKSHWYPLHLLSDQYFGKYRVFFLGLKSI